MSVARSGLHTNPDRAVKRLAVDGERYSTAIAEYIFADSLRNAFRGAATPMSAGT
jgi:hypothetical protein